MQVRQMLQTPSIPNLINPDERHADAPEHTTLTFVVLAVVRRHGDTWWADIPRHAGRTTPS